MSPPSHQETGELLAEIGERLCARVRLPRAHGALAGRLADLAERLSAGPDARAACRRQAPAV